jgi:alanine racemase
LITAEVATGQLRPAWAEIDLGAIRHNAAVLAEVAAPARLCAVVKAGGYGHGAAAVARAALEGRASWLAVALVEEGLELRAAGVTAPILLLSQPIPAAMPEVVAASLTPTVYTEAGLEALRQAARAASARGFPVHVKVDTGMHRVGADPVAAVALAAAVGSDAALRLEGFWTHFAIADEIDDPYTTEQLARFDAAVASLAARGIRPPVLHAANSAGAMWHPPSRYGLVRCGIALYGLAPCALGMHRPPVPDLRPALALKARVSHIQELRAGERVSYGLRYQLARDSIVATVPLGYADGVTRGLSAAGGEVLLGGTRRGIAGTVTMDQILVDCGPRSSVAVGDEVVLLGSQAGEHITAWEWAMRTGTIAYEVVCGVSGRVPRIYVGG